MNNLADEFSSGTALSIFEDWSRGGTKWDTDAERIIKDASSGGGRTISTIVYHAKQGGWDASSAAREAISAAPDGGTAVETNTASSPTPTTEDDSGLGWNGIRDLFKSNERGTSDEATQAAAM